MIERNTIPLLMYTILLLGCAEQLTADPGPEATQGDGEPTSLIASTTLGDDVTFTTVNAADDEAWVYFSFLTGSEVSVVEPQTDATWDLGFQRFRIKSNGGISGQGGVRVAKVFSPAFDELSQAPSQGWLADAADSGDDDTDDDLVFLGAEPWYDYDPVAHTLSPKAVTYVVEATDGGHYKLEMADYYDGAGTSGFPAFRWATVEAPPAADAEGLPPGLAVDASSTDQWQYVNVLSGTLVTVDNPEESTDWDIAFKGVQLRTNGGTSGGGVAGAMEVEGLWADLQSSPSVGYKMDTMVPVPGPPGSGEFSGNPVLNEWYDYDMSTHQVSPKDTAYLIRSANGSYAKLQIADYADSVYTVRLAPVSLAIETHSSVLDAADADAPAYFRFDIGEQVSPSSPIDDRGWDLSLSRTQLQTNSGTSGSGAGGAQDPEAASLADIMGVDSGMGCYLIAGGHVCDCELSQDACATESGIWTDQCGCASTFEVDTMVPKPGPPGSGEMSANPALNGWYDYDMTTHVTSPKPKAYILRTAAGDYVKLQITSYADGQFTVDWAYAGPGRTAF